MAWTKMVDLEFDDEDSLEAAMPIPMAERPAYPYGLRISLTDKELKKLSLDADCDVGDVIDLRAFAVVTSVSRNKTEGGEECCRVELQIQKLAVENEADEDTDG